MNTQIVSLIVAFIATIILGIIVVPILRKFKMGQIVRDDGPKSHLKKQGTPIMGGLIMLIVLTGAFIICSFKFRMLALPLVAILGFGIIGFIDDYKKLLLKNTEGLSPIKKIIGLFIVSAIFVFMYLNIYHMGTETIIPFVNQPVVLSVGAFIVFIMFILLATSNAVNLTDGLDGLATGVVAIIMTFFTIMAIKAGERDMIVFGATTVGTCLGFLIFNFNPARVFMGDTGSFALGGAIAAVAIILKMPLYLAIVAFVCVVDTLSDILQVGYFKLTKGKRIFKMAPFHHHLELSGMKETNVVLLFWAVTAICCVIAYFI